MSEQLAYAARKLQEGDLTLFLYSDDGEFCSTENGIAPLLSLIGTEKWRGAFAADKIVGKAAAMLYVVLGVKALYAEVLSESAKEILDAYPVEYEYGTLTGRIINRKGDGDCPMEEAVKDIDDPADAPGAIREKLSSLRAH